MIPEEPEEPVDEVDMTEDLEASLKLLPFDSISTFPFKDKKQFIHHYSVHDYLYHLKDFPTFQHRHLRKLELKLLVSKPAEETELEPGKVYVPNPDAVEIWKANGVLDIDRLLNEERFNIYYDKPFTVGVWHKGRMCGHNAIF